MVNNKSMQWRLHIIQDLIGKESVFRKRENRVKSIHCDVRRLENLLHTLAGIQYERGPVNCSTRLSIFDRRTFNLTGKGGEKSRGNNWVKNQIFFFIVLVVPVGEYGAKIIFFFLYCL